MVASNALPDERALHADLRSGRFRLGVAHGRWGFSPEHAIETAVTWPHLVIWVSAAPRSGAPGRYHLRLECSGYPTLPPSGTFWDPGSANDLEFERRPTGGERVGKVFRTDWESGRALYHPYDRVAAKSHGGWTEKYPGLVWTRDHTIVDLLTEVHKLLQCGDYTGVRG